MEPHARHPDGTPHDEVLTNAEWLYLTGELLDADIRLLEAGATDTVTAHCLSVLTDLVHERHPDEVCDHCREHLDGPKSLCPDNPACEGKWCYQATLDWLSFACAEPDED